MLLHLFPSQTEQAMITLHEMVVLNGINAMYNMALIRVPKLAIELNLNEFILKFSIIINNHYIEQHLELWY